MSALPLSISPSSTPSPVPQVAEPTMARVAEESLSPSLGGRERGHSAAFEVKFLLSEEMSHQVESALKEVLRLDPYADPRQGNAYQITSTYLDTPRLDVFHRLGRHRLRKFRLRRYGDASWCYLERKTKRKNQVRKHRNKADLAQLPLLAASLILEPWDGAWFHRQVTRWQLSPTCQVSYLRRAYFGESDGSPIRLTFDRQLRAKRLSGWTLFDGAPDHDILGEQVICELKFRGAMPVCFRNVVAELALAPKGASKYRRSLEALGVNRQASEGSLADA